MEELRSDIEVGEVMYTTLTDHSKTAQSHLQRCPNPCPCQTPSDIHHIHFLNDPRLEQTTQSTIRAHTQPRATYSQFPMLSQQYTIPLTNYQSYHSIITSIPIPMRPHANRSAVS